MSFGSFLNHSNLWKALGLCAAGGDEVSERPNGPDSDSRLWFTIYAVDC